MADDSTIPPVVDVVLELGIKRINAPIQEPGMGVFYPRMMLWVHHPSGMIVKHELLEPGTDHTRAVVISLEGVADAVRGLPREIRVRDVKLAGELRAVLEKVGVSVVVREDLPGLDEAFEGMSKMGGGPPRPSVLDVPGMKLDHLHAFAEAAKAFCEAAPWRQLDDSDLIQIEGPAGPKNTQFTVVMGAGGQTFGLGFMATRQAHETLQETGAMPKGGVWSLQLDEIDGMPFEDGEIWEENNLPVAAKDAYPFFIKYLKSKPPVHPTPDELMWAEGLLRAITATTEDEMDSGRWEKTVETAKGEVTYKLSLPILLEQMAGKNVGTRNDIDSMRGQMEMMLRAVAQQIEEEGLDGMEGKLQTFEGTGPQFEPKTDADRAQKLVYEARQASGRRVIQLARQALALDPDCADALVVLAERETEPKEAAELLRRAVEAGERSLGEEFFKENAGEFWGILETRPYMRARAHLARLLSSFGKVEEAAGHYRELLRLNPNDNQGNRYMLAHALLKLNQLDELDYLLNRMFADEEYAEWSFTRALLEFRRHGDTPASRQRLAEATRQNPHVVPMLTGRREMPGMLPPTYQPGGEDEAVLTVDGIGAAWIKTPGAIEWLERAVPEAPGKTKRSKGKKGSPKRGEEPGAGGTALF